jgi:outer membrane lipoprotein SlyB
MTTHILRRTHPLVLTAAVAVTVFSVLGSAAITGIIPSAHPERAEAIQPTPESSPQVAAPSGSGDGFKSVVVGHEPAAAKPADQHADTGNTAAKRKPSLAANGSKPAACSTCGVIESIRMVQHEGDGSGLGAVAGGVAGGMVGNQIGKGKGNTLMTLLGIGGGAYAGHTIEKKMKTTTAYVVKVRMEDGTYRTVTQNNQPEYAVGDHVRVAGGHLTEA